MELHYFSATNALSKFKNKTLSPVELTEAIIERSEKINPKINAHIFTFYEDAMINAKKSEDKYFANNDKILLLEGIPLAIKDEEDMNLFRDNVLVNGKEISSSDLGWTLCYPFNILNRLPVLSIPSGLAS